jgi:putative transposase
VSVMCEVLNVSRCGFYARAGRPRSARSLRREELAVQVHAAYTEARGLYGSPRVTAELNAKGVAVCENTVARVMKERQIRARTARRFRPRTTDSAHGWRPADNVLDRNFEAKTTDSKWCVDITYIETAEGLMYLAAAIDLCSRRIVGWSMAGDMKAGLCLDALEMAVLHRRPAAGLVHHSDRGVQYACDAYQARLEELGMTMSMSGKGDCYDNAPIESFWGTLKRELVYLQPGGRFATRDQARREIFEYIEVFYNRRRRHSAIGYISPEAFEASLN